MQRNKAHAKGSSSTNELESLLAVSEMLVFVFVMRACLDCVAHLVSSTKMSQKFSPEVVGTSRPFVASKVSKSPNIHKCLSHLKWDHQL